MTRDLLVLFGAIEQSARKQAEAQQKAEIDSVYDELWKSWMHYSPPSVRLESCSNGQAIRVAKNQVAAAAIEIQACQKRPIGMKPRTRVPSVQNQLS